MLITRFTHACIRVDDGPRSLVIDPGIWSEPEALIGADAVLVTHEHSDHVDVLRLAGLGAPVYLPASAHVRGAERLRGLDLRLLQPYDRVDIAGFTVQAVGDRHARVLPDRDICTNFGYLIGGAPGGLLYHPGDALHVPELAAGERIAIVCIPMQASWLKLAEALEFRDAIGAATAFGIHDAQVNERGIASLTSHLSRASLTDFQSLQPGESLR